MTHIKTIDAKTLKQRLDQNTVVVIDVREPEEYAEVHIPGTILIPLGELKYEVVLSEIQGRGLVVHCRSGQRSHRACEQLLQAKPNLDVYNLEGGILAWMALGYPVETRLHSRG